MHRAIAYANQGKLRFRTGYEQQLWNECSRLIANCIIYYNTVILSEVLEKAEKSGDREQIERLQHLSPCAWQHIILQGHYEFRKEHKPIHIADILRQLEAISKNRPFLREAA